MNWLRQRFELSHGDALAALRAMEGLRGLAIFLVFLVHYVTLVEPWITAGGSLPGLAGALRTVGHAGVDLFFVLSGYLIYGSLLARRQPFPGYFRRRIQRIYPVFLTVLAVYVALSFVFPAQSKLPADPAAAAIYLLQNLLLLPGLLPIEPIISVAWSLSYEMFYYLTIPLLIGLLGLRERSVRWRVLFFGAATIALGLACAWSAGPIRLVMFVAGILLYETLRAGLLRPPPAPVAAAAALLALLGLLWPTVGSAGYAVQVAGLFVGFFMLCHACFAPPATALARLFCWTPLRWLGNMSYSYYLIHGLALKAMFLVLGKLWPPQGQVGPALFALLGGAAFAGTVLVAAVLFLSVERPLSLAPRRRGAAALSASAA